MIHVILDGRLGNWMFQYAAGRAMSLRLGTTVAIHTYRLPEPKRALEHLACFPLQAELWSGWLSRFAARYLPWLPGERGVEHDGFDVAAHLLKVVDGCRIEGWFQSEAWFEDVKEDIRRELTPSADLSGRREHELLTWIDAREVCAVHVRRGDYVGKPLHNVCTPTYFSRAMCELRAIRPKVQFLTFSDDIDWCRRQACFADARFVDTEEPEKNCVQDLALMARCQHHIISNSTYSWWAAWLAGHPGQLVMTPSRWFQGDVKLNQQAMANTPLPAWRRVPVE